MHLRPVTRLWATVLTIGSALSAVAPLAAAECDRGPLFSAGRSLCAMPAKPAPNTLWGALQPTDTPGVALPVDRDTTGFNEATMGYYTKNWFFGLDVENGWVFAGLAHGIGVWDARTNPDVPTLTSVRRYPPGSPGAMPYVPPGEASKIAFGWIDAPEGVDNVVALAGYNGAGILVFDLSNKAEPRPAYQNTGRTSEGVYAARIGGTNWAFLAASTPGVVTTYNLSVAAAMSGCRQDDQDTPNDCAGARRGNFPGISGTPYYIHGAGNLVVVSYGSSRGFQVFNVANPEAPELRLTHLTGPTGKPVNGVAMWQSGGSSYVAARVAATASGPARLEIYDVSCAASGACSNPPLTGVFAAPMPGTSQYVSFSRDGGGRPHLYLGSDAINNSAVAQREFLLDVSNPSAPFDISPTNTIQASGLYNGVTHTFPVSYWSSYYRESPTGFNLLAPRAGKFNGDNFYRAARSVLDFHKKAVPSPPTANFSWTPSEVYPGLPVQFFDASTGQPNAWDWSFQSGAPGTSSAQNPAGIVFSGLGAKTVTLTASNGQGSSTPVAKTVTVLDPAPQIGSVVAAPSTTFPCQPVALSATGVTGQPTLSYSWRVLDSNSLVVFGPVTTPTTSWTPAAGAVPGIYTADLAVNNTVGPQASSSQPITLTAMPTLAFLGANGAPENDPFQAGTVRFHARSQAATEWNWDFGDGQGYRGWTGQYAVSDPTFTYTSIGPKTARVKIRNCVTGEIESAPLVIAILQTTPLHAEFRMQVFCTLGTCSGDLNVAIGVTDSSTGAELWDYDWDGNGTYEDANNAAPRTTHTYTSGTTVTPKLRVRRGAAEQDVYTHASVVLSTPPPPPPSSVSVSGPSSGAVGVAYSFSASSFNCTPVADSWTWGLAGGTAAGATNGALISITWASSGSRSVTASNPGCPGLTGTRVINIGTGTGGGTLQASFTFTPVAPKAGEVITFSGASSTPSANITGYRYEFGDGTNSGVNPGSAATHTYAAPGSYLVALEVSAPGTCPQTGNVCFHELKKTVVVQSSEPPLTADIVTSAVCTDTYVGPICEADAGDTISFTAVAPGATSFEWTFGDATPVATSEQVTHRFSQGGSFAVTLLVTRNSSTAFANRLFEVTDRPKTVSVPYISQAPAKLTSDLFINNPNSGPLTVDIYFRRRGLPQVSPPKVERTIVPGGTVFLPNVLGQLFQQPNNTGHIEVEVTSGDGLPVVSAYETGFTAAGKPFSGIVRGRLISPSSFERFGDKWHLIGLNDNTERDATFGLTNVGEDSVEVRVDFIDSAGSPLSASSLLTVPGFGQKQFTLAELRNRYNVKGKTDYRVALELTSEGDVFAWGAGRRKANGDPSFVGGVSAGETNTYFLGALDTAGPTGGVWQTDVLLSNPGDNPQSVELRFIDSSVNPAARPPLVVDLAARQTKRLVDVLSASFGAVNKVGLLSAKALGTTGPLPLVAVETYDNQAPTKRYGQSLAAFYDGDVAAVDQKVSLVGLRQDSAFRSNFWVATFGSDRASFDVIYRDFDGNVVGQALAQGLAGGKVRQFLSAALPAVPNGLFTVDIVVRNGRIIVGGQVVSAVTGDPAYVRGEVR